MNLSLQNASNANSYETQVKFYALGHSKGVYRKLNIISFFLNKI